MAILTDIDSLSGSPIGNELIHVVSFATNLSGDSFNLPLSGASNIFSGATDSYTNNASLSGNTLIFDNNIQGTNLYNVDLTSIVSGETLLWTAGTGTDGVVQRNSGGDASGGLSVSQGSNTIASGETSHAEGLNTQALGDKSHAEGSGSIASGETSHAEGNNTQANGLQSHAEGSNTIADGSRSHAEGLSTQANGVTSHAEGDTTIASGITSHAEGLSTIAGGNYSHAEGRDTVASGVQSHAEGEDTIASGYASHAQGQYTEANGGRSHVGGQGRTSTDKIISTGAASFTHFRQTFSSVNLGTDSPNSTILGGLDHNIGSSANSAAILGGSGHTINSGTQTNSAILGGSGNSIGFNASNSAVIGGTAITAAKANYVYIPNLSIENITSAADDADAALSGLTIGNVYQTDGTGASPLNVAGILMIKQ